jgi:uncharacterized protein DUF6134
MLPYDFTNLATLKGWLPQMMKKIARLCIPARRPGRHMFRKGVLAFLGLALGILTSTAVGAAQPDPIELYGGKLIFDIVRNGDTIGSQTLSFQKQNDDLTVNVVTDIDVQVLFVTVYRYRYEATTRWHAGRVQEMTATTNDDGKVSKVTARVAGNETAIQGPAGRFQSPCLVFPGEHWNLEEIRQSGLLNSVTGKLDRITVADQGRETIATREGKRVARRYVFSGDLKLTIWYDAEGRWVGLRFLARDGSTIDYVCRQCGPADKNSAAG